MCHAVQSHARAARSVTRRFNAPFYTISAGAVKEKIARRDAHERCGGSGEFPRRAGPLGGVAVGSTMLCIDGSPKMGHETAWVEPDRSLLRREACSWAKLHGRGRLHEGKAVFFPGSDRSFGGSHLCFPCVGGPFGPRGGRSLSRAAHPGPSPPGSPGEPSPDPRGRGVGKGGGGRRKRAPRPP